MKITFLRHAESEFNKNPAVDRDCGLTEVGRQQASGLVGWYPIVLCSPLLRARQTLRFSCIGYDRVEFEPLVREHRVDACDFMDREEHCFETEEQLIMRGDEFLRKLQHSYSQFSSILVVSHCEFICSVTGQSPMNACYVDMNIPDFVKLNIT